MVKLIVKKAFRDKENLDVIFEEGQEIEVTEERAKDIMERLPGYAEEVKPKPKPKQTTRKQAPKRKAKKDDESEE